MSSVAQHTNLILCTACGNETECNQQKFYPDNGWVLPFDTFGYYGGFSDDISVLIGERRSREWILCHDCVAKLLSLFPRLTATLERGLHNCENDTPCCEFAWRATPIFGKYEHDENGRLVPVSGAHYQVVENGKWIDAKESAEATGE